MLLEAVARLPQAQPVVKQPPKTPRGGGGGGALTTPARSPRVSLQKPDVAAQLPPLPIVDGAGSKRSSQHAPEEVKSGLVSGGRSPALLQESTRQDDPLLDVLHCLLCGANVNAVDAAHGDTALILAARKGDLACVELLLLNGADVKLANAAGWTPLHVMAEVECFACARSDRSPFLTLSLPQRGDAQGCSLLFKRGASPNAKTEAGQLPADLTSNPDCVTLLRLALLSLDEKAGAFNDLNSFSTGECQ